MEYSKEISLVGAVFTKQNILNLIGNLEKENFTASININFKNSENYNELTQTEFKELNFEGKAVKSIKLKFEEFDDQGYRTFSKGIVVEYSIWGEYYKVNITTKKETDLAILTRNIEEWKTTIVKNKPLKWLSYSFVLHLIMIGLIWVPLTLLFFNKGLEITASITMSFFIFIILDIGLTCLLRYIFPKYEIDIGKNIVKRARNSFGWIVVTILIPWLINLL
ncbi:MAG: hypothetical protein II988_00430 [Clostridia bacterium]|nr:hypothetical protein [Clostridia bacterium]